MMFSLFLSLSYFIAMCSMNSINPESSEEVVPEGGNIKLSCKYEGSINNIQWFQQQQQRSRPEFLLLITEDGFISAEISGFSAHINKTDKRVDLKIISAKVTDSAVYYCAVRPTVTGNTTTLYKNTTSTRGSHTLLHLSVCDDVSFI
ncbi:Ig heavy chain V region XIG14 [Solea senegalensis]|uniref:Ig heavy chain V region XIG14 n=1 Tax=Solea senegalensis TaxID=28829 RepID=A0AAV6T635_SOLSE|nr:Ig heavy chain V region XIG14 [Solea senegalensis]